MVSNARGGQAVTESGTEIGVAIITGRRKSLTVSRRLYN